MIIGLVILGFGVGVFTFVGCEVRHLRQRNLATDSEINKHKVKQISLVSGIIRHQTLNPYIHNMFRTHGSKNDIFERAT